MPPHILYFGLRYFLWHQKQTGVNKSNRKNVIEDFREFGFWILFPGLINFMLSIGCLSIGYKKMDTSLK